MFGGFEAIPIYTSETKSAINFYLFSYFIYSFVLIFYYYSNLLSYLIPYILSPLNSIDWKEFLRFWQFTTYQNS
jgi:hypothetical protein